MLPTFVISELWCDVTVVAVISLPWTGSVSRPAGCRPPLSSSPPAFLLFQESLRAFSRSSLLQLVWWSCRCGNQRGSRSAGCLSVIRGSSRLLVQHNGRRLPPLSLSLSLALQPMRARDCACDASCRASIGYRWRPMFTIIAFSFFLFFCFVPVQFISIWTGTWWLAICYVNLQGGGKRVLQANQYGLIHTLFSLIGINEQEKSKWGSGWVPCTHSQLATDYDTFLVRAICMYGFFSHFRAGVNIMFCSKLSHLLKLCPDKRGEMQPHFSERHWCHCFVQAINPDICHYGNRENEAKL